MKVSEAAEVSKSPLNSRRPRGALHPEKPSVPQKSSDRSPGDDNPSRRNAGFRPDDAGAKSRTRGDMNPMRHDLGRATSRLPLALGTLVLSCGGPSALAQAPPRAVPGRAPPAATGPITAREAQLEERVASWRRWSTSSRRRCSAWRPRRRRAPPPPGAEAVAVAVAVAGRWRWRRCQPRYQQAAGGHRRRRQYRRDPGRVGPVARALGASALGEIRDAGPEPQLAPEGDLRPRLPVEHPGRRVPVPGPQPDPDRLPGRPAGGQDPVRDTFAIPRSGSSSAAG
jgi:hypothetical protein